MSGGLSTRGVPVDMPPGALGVPTSLSHHRPLMCVTQGDFRPGSLLSAPVFPPADGEAAPVTPPASKGHQRHQVRAGGWPASWAQREPLLLGPAAEMCCVRTVVWWPLEKHDSSLGSRWDVAQEAKGTERVVLRLHISVSVTVCHRLGTNRNSL